MSGGLGLARRRTAAFATALIVGASLVACGGGSTSSTPTGPAAATTPGTTPATSAPATPLPISPLTGLPGANNPVVAVKVDNVANEPQSGLNQADVVYVELVEGGLTRLVPIFASQQPTKVGPVRSARLTDIQLLGQYGKVAFTFSGGAAEVIAAVRSANVRFDGYSSYPGVYRMDPERVAPYRYLLDVAALAAQAPGVVAKDIGFRFGAPPAAPATGLVAARSVTTQIGTTRIGADWDVATKSWLLSRDGGQLMLTDGSRVSATNVLVEYVSVSATDVSDHNGVHSPLSKTVGTGPATLFRDGVRYDGTWSRKNAAAPTTWTSTAGTPLTLAPGRTWVLLAPRGSVLSAS
jgi:hypothetical protein